MRTFLLLLLSLMTGCEAVSNVKGCRDGWVEFTCKYRGAGFTLIKLGYTLIESSKNNEWETTNSISLYRDTKNKKVRVVIKKLKQQDFAEYQCEEQGSKFNTVKLDKDKGCQGPFIQTAYKTAKTTITCNYQGNRDESDVLFFCKENHATCEDILATESSPKSNKTFTLTVTNTGFNVSISEVSAHHAGVYWCGLKSNKGSYRAGFRKIQLDVEDITHFTRSLTIGQNFTYWCAYPNVAPVKKFICKGEDPSICEPLVDTMQLNKNTGRFSMDKNKRKITITVRDVTADDTGTYWCGAKSTDEKYSNPFYHRFLMTVVQTPTPTPRVSSAQPTTTSTSAENNVQTSRQTTPPPPPAPTQTPTPTPRVSSAQPTTTSLSAENNGSNITVTVCVVVLLVLFVLILLFIYKRFSHSKNTRNEAAAQNIREDNNYEEVEEHVPRENSGNVTASCSTDPSGSLHYATINFKKHTGKAGGRKAPIIKPSSSACEYSTVKRSQSPTYYNVNPPSSYIELPLYSTVKKQKTNTHWNSNLERVDMV